MKRITPEEVVEAFKVTGATPVRSTWVKKLSGTACCCALGAILYQNVDRTDDGAVADLIEQYENMADVKASDFFADRNLSYSYIIGFVDGFDDVVPVMRGTSCDAPKDYQLGAEDGKKALEAVIEQIGPVYHVTTIMSYINKNHSFPSL